MALRRLSVPGCIGAALWLATLAAVPGCGGDAPGADAAGAGSPGPALWQVSDADTTVYLFGTFHALKGDVVWFDGKIRDAYAASDEVALEAIDLQDVAKVQRLTMRYGIDPMGKPLSATLSSDTTAQLKSALEGLGLPLQVIEPMEPWMAATMLASLQIVDMGYDPNLGVDLALRGRAEEAGKTLTGLENAEKQLAMLDALPLDTQLSWLRLTLDEWDEGPQFIEKLTGQWLSGDVEAFSSAMHESMEEVPHLADVLLRDRNERFARWIVDRMDEPGTVFFAVGAGHLAGRDSVQEFLRAEGLDAQRL